MMKLKVSLFLAMSCTPLNFIASAQGSRQNSQEIPVAIAIDLETSSSQNQSTPTSAARIEPESSSPKNQPIPFSVLRYSVWTAAGKTNTSYLVERDEDGSLAATLQQDSTRAQELYRRATRERFGKDLSDERNQERLKIIIEIGKKHSKNIENAEKNKLELDPDPAKGFRAQQEQAFLALLSQQKNELTALRSERKAAETLAASIFNQGVETMKSRAAVMSHNYNYLKKQSKHALPLIGNADKQDPYKTIQSFSALLDSIPTQAQKDNTEKA